MRLEINLKINGSSSLENKILNLFKENEDLNDFFLRCLANIMIRIFRIEKTEEFSFESCKFIFIPDDEKKIEKN